MPVSARQFQHLQVMGIPVWQQNKLGSPAEESTNLISLSLEELQKHAFFSDVLLALNISIGEISINNNTLNMGLFNWQFIDSLSIEYKENLLTTPELKNLTSSVSLKKQLWQTLSTNLM
jgi:DNA polymerase III psi subunit